MGIRITIKRDQSEDLEGLLMTPGYTRKQALISNASGRYVAWLTLKETAVLHIPFSRNFPPHINTFAGKVASFRRVMAVAEAN